MHWPRLSLKNFHCVLSSELVSGSIFFQYPKPSSWNLCMQAKSTKSSYRPPGIDFMCEALTSWPWASYLTLLLSEDVEDGPMITTTSKGYYRIKCIDSYKALGIGPGIWNCHYWCVGACRWKVPEALMAPTHTHPCVLFPQVRLQSCLLLHRRAMPGHAGAWQRPGPDDWRHGQCGLLDLHHHLHLLPKAQAVTLQLALARPKKLLLHSHPPFLCWAQFGVVFISLILKRPLRTKASSLLCDPYGFSAPNAHMVLLPCYVPRMY